MGHSHQWWYAKNRVWPAVKGALDKVLAAFGDDHVKIQDRGKDCVIFNGVGDAACEDFLLQRDPSPTMFCFCKTKHNAYDRAVLACLVAAYHAGALYVTGTDGSPDEWEEATALVRKELDDDTVKNPMEHVYSAEEKTWLDKCEADFVAFYNVPKEDYGL